ncbi:trypsin-like serine protease [Mollisia scopiformis]|uniref:Pro-apoptotic serine protease NMA111 n=1 Tax=Mollisia scopiformis TaxID=149040 RepID=A0A194XAA2_MOLSC|nr:trypsin-like serine protease [Mollisia scopiformis]KUJ16692.1 trypsin-like serine protease [Mollisia scopiformis]
MGEIENVCGRGPKETIQLDVKWQKTLDKAAKGVVTVKFCHTWSFDAEDACSSEATGFVVDAERGYILTNRHVAGPNPFWGRCIFENHEEVDVHVIYYDPVHDFGILRYEPKSIRHMFVSAIALRPDLAKVSEEVRLIGNDAGEKLSIQSAVISRVDRNAPDYGKSTYNDFNINYIQAAAGATGGSSGSPVVNIDGQAVALQAGGRNAAATDYFLPLDRPLRALECLQKGEPITRGTIQCQWKFNPFNECQGLGLSSEWETAFREAFPNEVGMLVAERIIPEGPSDSKIKVGDILIKVNGKLLAQFKNLDDILDSSVGCIIDVLLQRRGEDVEVQVEVADLHKITPNRLVSVAGATFQDLSYQRARAHGVACKGVFLCNGQGSFFPIPDNRLIQKVDSKATPDLDTFIEVMKAIPDQARVVVTSTNLNDPLTPQFHILCIDRYWSKKMRQFVRNDKTGLWDSTDLADAITRLPPVPRTATFVELRGVPPLIADIARSVVKVKCFAHQELDNTWTEARPSVGVVIDAEKGVVLVSRATLPHGLCNISITIADSITVEGEVLFLHILHNYALIKYDPKLVIAPVKSVKLSSKPVEQGASLYFVGFKNNNIGGPICTRTTVTEVCNLQLEPNSDYPKIRAMNSDTVKVDTRLANDCGSGFLINDEGIVQALWLTSLYYNGDSNAFHYYGLPSSTVVPIVSRVRKGEIPKLCILSVEFEGITMSQAYDMKVSTEWVNKVEVANTSHHQLFKVKKRTIQCEDTSRSLLEGDIILTMNGNIVTRISELDIMDDAETVDVRVVRDGEEVNLKLQTVLSDDLETKRALLFCGALLHAPHHDARLRVGKPPSEVFVSCILDGSPARHYGLHTTMFLTHINAIEARDLDSFLEAAMAIPDNTNFTLTTRSLSGIEQVMKMKRCDHYFPTMEYIRASPKWIARSI